ncbi:unnamed protein product [Rhizoctonia solani]|uniref:Uncharacterized protein n=1 Tax=Rhizoctonia solani TaxID=456999 RepID=A0A8H3C826_9AGAM|nr:unnamed protein product [Rhizoctonia solani]
MVTFALTELYSIGSSNRRMLTRHDVSNLGTGDNPSQHNATIDANHYIYNGEDDVPDNGYYNDTGLKTNVDGDSDGPKDIGPYMYRQLGAISSSSSLASAPTSASEPEFDALEPAHLSESHIYDSRNVPKNPETLMGPNFTILAKVNTSLHYIKEISD